MSRRGSTPSLVVEGGDPGSGEQEEEGEESSLQQQSGGPSSIPGEDSITATSHGREQGTRSLGQTFREKSWFGKKCVKIFRVFSNTFAMTFLAEWGDRSQVGPPLEFRKVFTITESAVSTVSVYPAGHDCDGGY